MCEVSLLLIGTIDFHVTAENGRFTSKCNVVLWRTTSNECTKMSHVQHDDFLFFSSLFGVVVVIAVVVS